MADFEKEKENIANTTEVKRRQKTEEFGGAGSLPDDAIRLEPKTSKEKLENFWYYNKNYVIAVVFIVVVLFTYFYSTIFEPDADGTISIISQIYFYDASDHISEVWSEFAIDLNGDGKRYVKVIPIQSDPNGDFGMDSTMYQAAALTVNSHIRTASNFLFMLDETNYLLLKEQGVQFTDLSTYTTNLDFDNEMYELKDTELAKALGYSVTDMLYFALLDFSSLTQEQQSDGERIVAYENDFKLLQSLIDVG